MKSAAKKNFHTTGNFNASTTQKVASVAHEAINGVVGKAPPAGQRWRDQASKTAYAARLPGVNSFYRAAVRNLDTKPFHSPAPAPDPNQNRLLAALPAAEFERLNAHLKLTEMRLGEALYEPGVEMKHVYFPATCIVSLHYVTESGASAETAGVGNEGVVGVSLFMGGDTTPGSAVIQTAGSAYRLESRLLMQEFSRTGPLRGMLLRYTQALITQMAQTAVCNRHHAVEQQLCRWLLLTLDRLPSPELVMTQELVASVLGVRRESITDAAGTLQQLGFISYRRGHISILDRVGLEQRSCECYGVVRKEMNRLLPEVLQG